MTALVFSIDPLQSVVVATETKKVVGADTTVRRAVAALALILSCTALALGGLWLGLRLSTPGTYGSALGAASFQVKTSEHGGLEVFIPLTDWGARPRVQRADQAPRRAPRPRTARRWYAAAQGNSALLTPTSKDLSRDGRLALERAAPLPAARNADRGGAWAGRCCASTTAPIGGC